MPTDQQPLDVLINLNIAETLLQCAGVVLLAGGAIVLTLRRRWRPAVRLPALRGRGFRALDVLAAFYALLFFPVLFAALLQATGDVGATSQPADAPIPNAILVWADVLGKICAAAFLCWMGVQRMKGGRVRWGLRADHLPRDAIIAGLAYVAVWPGCATILRLAEYAIEYANSKGYQIDLPQHEAIRTLLSEETTAVTAALTIVGAVVLAPVVEELFFRGILQTTLARVWRSQWRAIAVSAVAFGCIHYPNVQTIPALMLFGAVLGFAYAKSRSLTLVILLHAIFNLKTILWINVVRDHFVGGS